MPIYAYRCDACGFAKDVLQKMSDAPLTDCVSCGKATFKKQLTAAGFQLKGTGWYVTDFRGGSSAPTAPAAAASTATDSAGEGAGAPAASAAEVKSVAPAAATAPVASGTGGGTSSAT